MSVVLLLRYVRIKTRGVLLNKRTIAYIVLCAHTIPHMTPVHPIMQHQTNIEFILRKCTPQFEIKL
jgi:hypothetical protein